jgi:hypothetical protein
MKRKPPGSRHKPPFWTAPREQTAKRRTRKAAIGLTPAAQAMVNNYFKAAKASVIALAEGPGIRPLTRAERTQTIWSRQDDNYILTLKVRPPGIDRLLKLLYIQEGSPLCN